MSDEQPQPPLPETGMLIDQPIDDELKRSYLDYAMSVIIGRALPDVRDGLKPVHRRILYAMGDLGMRHNQPYKKCARIVGEVLGKYHPHGDQSVYDALVRMGQDFSLRAMLIDGQGNFGNIDGDPPAAMRYTEARLSKLSDELLQDLEKETVPMTENFDGSLEEPTVLPAKLPNLLLNGSTGIAVGMATNIPPHNLSEITKATIALIDNPDIDVLELAQHMPGPDFPTGGILRGKTGIMQYFGSGRGKLIVRSVIQREENKKTGKLRLIVSEIPFMVSKSTLVEQIADRVKDKVLEGISDIFDESNRDGIRVVIELKRDASPEVVESALLHHTNLQVTFGVIMLAIVDGQPRVLNLKQMLEQHVLHRRIVIRKRTEYDLRKAKEKEHLLEGLVIALDNIDGVVALIRGAKNVEEARVGLVSSYALSETQASAILEMRLSRLTNLEQSKIRDELSAVRELITELNAILASEERILQIIRNDLVELSQKYPSPRRTEIVDAEDEQINMEDLIAPEDVVVTITSDGYAKRLPVDTYRAQARGGKGVIAATMKEEDYVKHLFIANTHEWLLVFTDKGKIYWTKTYNLPEGSRQSKGKPLINIVQIASDEKVCAIIPVKEFSEDKFLLFATKNGLLKKTVLSAYGNIRQNGIIALNLEEGDTLVAVLPTSGHDTIFMATAEGMAVRCSETDVRSMGRGSTGVRGIRLADGDEVVGAIISHDNQAILAITENGYGKRTLPEEYRHINRGGKGVANIKTSDRNGRVVAVRSVDEHQDVMLISKSGITIRMPVSSISIIGRNTQGVRLMNLRDGDIVVACTVVDHEESSEENTDAPSSTSPPSE